MITKKRVTSIILALTVAVTSMLTVGMPTSVEAKSKLKVSKVKVNMEAPKKISAKLSTARGGYDDAVISWSKSKNAKGYYVYYKKNSKKAKWTYVGRTSKTYLTKKNLADGTNYVFLVRPYKQKGKTIYKSKKYKTVKITTLKKMSTPIVKKYASGKVKVYWKDIASQDGYQISKSTSKNKTNVVYTYKTRSGKSKVIKATNNKRYYYKVRAYKYVKVKGKTKKVYAPWSNVRSYKVSVKPSRPSNDNPIFRGLGNTGWKGSKSEMQARAEREWFDENSKWYNYGNYEMWTIDKNGTIWTVNFFNYGL